MVPQSATLQGLIEEPLGWRARRCSTLPALVTPNVLRPDRQRSLYLWNGAPPCPRHARFIERLTQLFALNLTVAAKGRLRGAWRGSDDR